MDNSGVPNKDRIEQMVRRVVHRTLGLGGGLKKTPTRPLVTERELNDLPVGGEYVVPEGALVTPLARQVAMDRRITMVEPTTNPAPTLSNIQLARLGSSSGKTVAIGADHGGFQLKEELKTFLAELGYAIVDCGTDSSKSVDYPDFAFAVAQLVGTGKAWRGIIIDGAGIGSSITANKVRGVRAAMCYDQATAVNSREHNDANVLTLGAGLIGSNLARQVVKTWLEATFGGGRHARRVDKITEIERRFTK
jgi:ribose 5-phosphate isomerase B